MEQMALQGKRPLVSGSVQGIGLAIATELARAGSDVVLHGLPDAAAHAAARSAIAAQSGRQSHTLAHDLADPAQVA